ncbi:MAG: hypothetical protein GX876_07795 [Bacteroidales bacterium]|nr:hypothetical protein [Bacteroidales bacterium]
MRKILYILLFNLTLFYPLKAQDIHQIRMFGDEQFRNGDYRLALKEYQRVLLFDNERIYNDLYSKIASIHYYSSEYDHALRYFDYAIITEINDSLRFELMLNKALCYFKMNNYMAALNELFDLPDPPGRFLQNRKNLYMGICYFGMNDYKNSEGCFSALLDSYGVSEIKDIFNDFGRFNKKFRPGKIELMSMLLPGLGQIYAGEIPDGLNSFLLISGVSFYSLVTAVNYAVIDGLLVLSSWFYRYYSGGFTNASDLAHKKLHRKKEEVYSEILALIELHQLKQ